MGIVDIAKQATNKITYKIKEVTYDPKAEAAALTDAAASPLVTKSSNVNQDSFNAYKGQWGAKAVTSGLIEPTYFKTYESILAIPPPPADANQQTFDAAVNSLAQTIKNWYVGAKYKGNLNELAYTIDYTKPKYVAPAGVKASVKPLVPKSATQQFVTSFTATLGSTLLILFLGFLFLLAGSLAANDAIGRSPGIRIVSFMYAAIPFFSPFVLIYYIYRYFKGNYPVFYNLLPVTTYTSANWFIGALLWPFYYIEDANSKFQHDEFDRIGRTFVWLTEPRTKEADEAADEVAAIKRAGLNETQMKEALGAAGLNNGRMNNEVPTAVQPNNNGRMNNEVPTAVQKPERMNSNVALNIVANAINNQPKPTTTPIS